MERASSVRRGPRGRGREHAASPSRRPRAACASSCVDLEGNVLSRSSLSEVISTVRPSRPARRPGGGTHGRHSASADWPRARHRVPRDPAALDRRLPRTRLALQQSASARPRGALKQTRPSKTALRPQDDGRGPVARSPPGPRPQTTSTTDAAKTPPGVTERRRPRRVHGSRSRRWRTADQRSYAYSPRAPRGPTRRHTTKSLIARPATRRRGRRYEDQQRRRVRRLRGSSPTASTCLGLAHGDRRHQQADSPSPAAAATRCRRHRATQAGRQRRPSRSTASPTPRQSNTISNAVGATAFIFGVELSLKGTGSFTASTSPRRPRQGRRQDEGPRLRRAYNATIDLMKAETTEKPVTGATTDLGRQEGRPLGRRHRRSSWRACSFAISSRQAVGQLDDVRRACRHRHLHRRPDERHVQPGLGRRAAGSTTRRAASTPPRRQPAARSSAS